MSGRARGGRAALKGRPGPTVFGGGLGSPPYIRRRALEARPTEAALGHVLLGHHIATQSACRGYVRRACVVRYHAVRTKSPGQRTD